VGLERDAVDRGDDGGHAPAVSRIRRTVPERLRTVDSKPSLTPFWAWPISRQKPSFASDRV
jgi:hypothetical protein